MTLMTILRVVDDTNVSVLDTEQNVLTRHEDYNECAVEKLQVRDNTLLITIRKGDN